MIYLACALYCEAQPWIQQFSLKKDLNSKRFQIFFNDSIRLIITKTGKVNAAIALTELFLLYPPADTDLLLNIGIAASRDANLPLGDGYLCRAIIDADTLRTYYPDLLFSHAMKEASLITYSIPQHKKADDWQQHVTGTMEQQTDSPNPVHSVILMDMEASGIYVAASHFLEQHQMLFYKIISDYGLEDSLSPESVSHLIAVHMDRIMSYLNPILSTLSQPKAYELTEHEQTLYSALCDALHFSVSMSYQLKQLLVYAKLTGRDLEVYLQTHLEQQTQHPCSSKKEGKQKLELIRNELL